MTDANSNKANASVLTTKNNAIVIIENGGSNG